MIDTLIERLNLDMVRQGYGATETGLVTAMPSNVQKTDSVGVLVPGKEAMIINPENGKKSGPNQVGELLIRSKEVTPGYLNNEKANRESFTEDGFFRTGDAMYYDLEGYLYVVDRYKEMIKVDTQQVAPPELETILLQHEAVAEAAVIGIPDEDHGQIPKAFVVVKVGKKRDGLEKELIDLIAGEVVDWKKLRGGVVFLDILPKIGQGKIDRVALKAFSRKDDN